MKPPPPRKKTRTSPFGTPGRISHDSSGFYAGRLYQQLPKVREVPYLENPVPLKVLDRIFCQTSEDMAEVPEASVHLMVTSPPYNVNYFSGYFKLLI